MCCFTRKVNSVSETKIFAREVEPGVQGLVYQMRVDAPEEVAMVLPLPVKTPAWERAVKFINLEGYSDFFSDLASAFPVDPPRSFSLGLESGRLKLIEVVEVGNYVASFVPTSEDFERLDPRFRLPKGSWEKLPHYHDYGFAVFQLKAGAQTVHPMALVFESRLAGELFFPTVHIHDGEVHESEHFDHVLYAQGWTNGEIASKGWMPSQGAIGKKVDEKKAQGLVWGDGPVWQSRMNGMLKNEDVRVKGRAKREKR